MTPEATGKLRLIEIQTAFEPTCKQRKLVDARLSLSDLQVLYGTTSTISFIEQTPEEGVTVVETIPAKGPVKKG